MNRHAIYIGFFLLLGLLPGCTDDDSINGIDTDLQVYFDRFAEEAMERGVVFKLDSIPVSAEITLIREVQIAGTCTRRDNSANDIAISGHFWNRADEMQKEFVVFHELGHCYLNREHLESVFPDGTCRSIMASGTGPCVTNYNDSTRSDYLDELFDN